MSDSARPSEQLVPAPFAPADPTDHPRASVTIRCVLENQTRPRAEAEALLRSVRNLAGPHRAAPVELYFVGGVPDDLAQFEPFGAVYKAVEPFDARCPHANKFRMFEEVETDYLLAVDADVIVVDDFSNFLVGEAVGISHEWGDWMPSQIAWSELFRDAGVPFPKERVLMNRFWQETVPYLNSGVIVLPAHRIVPFRTEWERQLVEMLDRADAGRYEWWGEKQQYFAEQVALTLALYAGQTPWRLLPIEMNWLMKASDLPRELSPNSRFPILIHTLHQMDDRGRVIPPDLEGCRWAAARYNALLSPAGDRAPDVGQLFPHPFKALPAKVVARARRLLRV